MIFGGGGEPELRVNVATVPFVLGRAMRIDPYEVRVTMHDEYSVAVTASTSDRNVSATVSVCFLDEKESPPVRSVSCPQRAGRRAARLGHDSRLESMAAVRSVVCRRTVRPSRGNRLASYRCGGGSRSR